MRDIGPPPRGGDRPLPGSPFFHTNGRVRRVGAIRGLAPAGVLLVLIALASSCAGGVTQDEFDAERAKVADLEATVDDANMEMAVVQSQLAQQTAQAADLGEKVEEVEAREALLAAFLAWNRKDSEAFRSSFTDQGISGTVLSLPDSIGDPPIGLRRMMEAEVSGDTVTVHVMFGLGAQRKSLRHSLVKTEEGWKIDGEERLSPKIKGATAAVDIQVDECSLESGSSTLATGNVAFRVENSGAVARHLAFVKAPEGLDAIQVVEGRIPEADVLAYVHDLQPGDQNNVAFTAPLDPGRYALVCVGPHTDREEGILDAVQGVVAELIVP